MKPPLIIDSYVAEDRMQCVQPVSCEWMHAHSVRDAQALLDWMHNTLPCNTYDLFVRLLGQYEGERAARGFRL